jgi:hypothetical protein
MKFEKGYIMHNCRFLSWVLLAASVFWSGSTLAANPAIIKSAGGSVTPLTNPRPFRNPLPAADASQARAEVNSRRLMSGVSIAAGVKLGSDPAVSANPSTRAFGDFGIPYSSTRVRLGLTNQTSASSPASLLPPILIVPSASWCLQ